MDSFIPSEPLDFKRNHNLEGNVIRNKGKTVIEGLKIHYDSFSKDQLVDLLKKAKLPHKETMDKEELIRIAEKNSYKGGKIDGILKISPRVVTGYGNRSD